MRAEQRGQEPLARLGSVLGSQAMSAALTIITLIVTVAGWIAHSPDAKNIFLGAETLLVMSVSGGYMWLHRKYIRLRRANSRQMSDPAFFDLVRSPFEDELTSDYEDIADGWLWLYAERVREVTRDLIRKLVESSSSVRRVRAVDLTTDPDLLATRLTYLAMNKTFIEAGGKVERVFVCRQEDLTNQKFCERFLKLVEAHRQIGVHCGLAVWDLLSSELAMDFVVYGTGAVLVEQEQGTVDYKRGRSCVYFKNIDRWIAKFEALWDVGGTPSAALRLQSYEAAARAFPGDVWDTERINESLAAR
jgi:hypothetical protein